MHTRLLAFRFSRVSQFSVPLALGPSLPCVQKRYKMQSESRGSFDPFDSFGYEDSATYQDLEDSGEGEVEGEGVEEEARDQHRRRDPSKVKSGAALIYLFVLLTRRWD